MSSLHPLARKVDHPAPLRSRVSPRLVVAALFAAPIAWSSQLLLSYSLIGDACATSLPPVRVTILVAVGVLAIAVALIGLAASYRIWGRTRAEATGDHHAGLTTGAGRTRFLGLCGLVGSTIFAIAAVFELLVPFLGSPCPTL